MKHFEYIYGFHAVSAILYAQPELIFEIIVVAERADQRIQQLLGLAQQNRITVKTIGRAEVKPYFEGRVSHQGIIAKCSPYTGFDESVLQDIVKRTSQQKLILVLDGVQDPHNLGACLRSANGFGAHAVVTTKDRACGLTPVVRKVACGAAEAIPFIQVTNLARTMQWMQEQGIWLVGMAGDTETRLQDVDLSLDLAIIMGNEAKGMRQLTRKQCDFIAKIPMQGTVESFNVSVATAVSLYEVVRQRGS